MESWSSMEQIVQKLNEIKRGHYCIDISGNDLKGVDFSGQAPRVTDFGRCNLDGSNLSKARFRECVFSSASLRGADLSGATFEECRFEGSDFTGANLCGAKFTGCTFAGANFMNSDIRFCYFNNRPSADNLVVLNNNENTKTIFGVFHGTELKVACNDFWGNLQAFKKWRKEHKREYWWLGAEYDFGLAVQSARNLEAAYRKDIRRCASLQKWIDKRIPSEFGLKVENDQPFFVLRCEAKGQFRTDFKTGIYRAKYHEIEFVLKMALEKKRITGYLDGW